jgi:hypothetical protein
MELVIPKYEHDGHTILWEVLETLCEASEMVNIS